MFPSQFRLSAVYALAAIVSVTATCAASAQASGPSEFLSGLFRGSERLRPPADLPSRPRQTSVQQQPALGRPMPFQQPALPRPAPVQQQPAQPSRVAQVPGADITVRLDRLEAQIRQLTGAIEQLQYRNQQLEAQLRAAQAPAPAPPPTRGTNPPPQAPPAPPPGRRGDAFDPAQHPNAPGAPHVLGALPSGGAAQGVPGPDDPVGAPLDLSTLAEPGGGGDRPPAQSGGPPNEPPAVPPRRGPSNSVPQVATLPPTDSPRDNYDLAYGYILRKDYALAEDGFRNFLQRFPSDRLVPEAQYWLGESMFQRQRYRDAAEAFLNVSTKHDTSARAPDALLRLGQSLAAMGEREAACASLSEVLRKYPRAAVAIRQGVDREQKRARC